MTQDFTEPPPEPFAVRLGRAMRQHPALSAIILSCLLIEAVLQGSDAGLWGNTDWRNIAYNYGAFIPAYLQGETPAYPLQPYAMFLTHGFLHGGLIHVGLNMLTLLSLGRAVEARLGQTRFLVMYVLSMIGGGALFALLGGGNDAMVGASGALFGLAGALLTWAWVDRRRAGQSMQQILRVLFVPVGTLVVLNGGLMIFASAAGLGTVAWQAHLGGCVTGIALALVFGRGR